MFVFRVLGVSTGATLAALCTALIAQASPATATISPVPVPPAEIQSVVTVILLLAAALLGAGTWLARPPGLMPTPAGARFIALKTITRGVGWGIFMAGIGFWRVWSLWKIFGFVFLAALGAEFLTEGFAFLGRQFARNPIKFYQTYKRGLEAQQDDLDSTQKIEPLDDGDSNGHAYRHKRKRDNN